MYIFNEPIKGLIDQEVVEVPIIAFKAAESIEGCVLKRNGKDYRLTLIKNEEKNK